MERPYLSSGKVKEKRDSNNGFEEDHPRAISWPAKQCYICSFCNRKFRSSQALGGHMNVHRRDRGRLLLLPSAAISGSHNPTRKINPKSNFASSPSSSSAKFLPRTHHPLHSSSFTSLSLSSLSSTSTASREEEKKLVTDLLQLDSLSSQCKYITSKKRFRGNLGFGEIKGFGQKDTSKLLRKEGAGSLDLEILKDSKQDLDLELRLGWF